MGYNLGRPPLYDKMREMGLSSQQLAIRLGIPEHTIHLRNALSGVCRPRPVLIEAITRVLGLKPEECWTERQLAKPFNANNRRLSTDDLDYLARSCAESGVPVKVTDPADLAEAASCLRGES